MIVSYLLKVAMLGSAWVMYLLLALSVASIGAMVDRWLFFRKRGQGGEELGDALCDLLEEGDRGRGRGAAPEARVDRGRGAPRVASLVERRPGRARRGDRRGDDQAPQGARARHDAARHARQQRAVRRPPRHRHRRHRGLRRPRRRERARSRWTRSWAASPRRSSPPAWASSSPSPRSSPTTSSRRSIADIEDNVSSVTKRLCALLGVVGTFGESPAPARRSARRGGPRLA